MSFNNDNDEGVEVKRFEFDLIQKEGALEGTDAFGKPKNWYDNSLKEEQDVPQEPEPQLKITIEELEQIRKEAYDDGFSEGKEQGYKVGYDEGFVKGKEEGFPKGVQEGLDAGMQQAEDLIKIEAARFSRYANHLVKPIADFDKEISSELIYLASRLAKAFIKEELNVSHKFLENSIWEVMRLLPMANDKVYVFVNPIDLPKVQSVITNPEIVLQEDGALSQGDLRVDMGLSSIDIRQEERIDNFIKDFLTLNAKRAQDAIDGTDYQIDDKYNDVDLNKTIETPQLSEAQNQEVVEENSLEENNNSSQNEVSKQEDVQEDPWAEFADELTENEQDSMQETQAQAVTKEQGGITIKSSQPQNVENQQSVQNENSVSTFSQGGLSREPKKL